MTKIECPEKDSNLRLCLQRDLHAAGRPAVSSVYFKRWVTPSLSYVSSVLPLDHPGLFADAEMSQGDFYEGKLLLLSTLTTLGLPEEKSFTVSEGEIGL